MGSVMERVHCLIMDTPQIKSDLKAIHCSSAIKEAAICEENLRPRVRSPEGIKWMENDGILRRKVRIGKVKLMPETWLDALPHQVCVRIASFLPKERKQQVLIQNDEFTKFRLRSSPVDLAELSKKQGAAATVANGHSLTVTGGTAEGMKTNFYRWLRVLGNDIRAVHFAKDFGCHIPVCRVLKLPTVVKVSMPCLPMYMKALFQCGSVKDLTLYLTHAWTRHETGMDCLPIVLSKCPVERLLLLCNSEIPCLTVERLFRLHRDLAKASIKILKLYCRCDLRRFCHHFKYLHRVIETFPRLEEFTFGQPEGARPSVNDTFAVESVFKKDVRQVLCRLNCVSLSRVTSAFEQAINLRTTMRALLVDQVLSLFEVHQLQKCPNLEVLDVWLERGAEINFPTNFICLRSICLRWFVDKDPKSHRRLERASAVALHEKCMFSGTEYYAVKSEFFSLLVEQYTALDEIRFQYVQIPRWEVEFILQHLGTRLRLLEVPIGDQGVCVQDQFSWLLRRALKYSPGLREWLCWEAQWYFNGRNKNSRDWRLALCERHLTDMRNELESGVRLLQRRMPRLCIGDLKDIAEFLTEGLVLSTAACPKCG